VREKAGIHPVLIGVLWGVATGLVGMVIVVQMDGGSGSRVNLTGTLIKSLEGQVRLFRLDHDRYPEELGDLYRCPSYVDPRKWPKGGYIPEPPVDEWGRPFSYRIPGEKGPFVIISRGRDGREGGEGLDADLWISPLR
jgi:general secretion pathway protein G